MEPTTFDKFRKLIKRGEVNIPPPTPQKSDFDKTMDSLKDLAHDERFPHFIKWIDSQIEIAESQRNITAATSDRTLLLSIGFENGLKAVKSFLTTLSKE